MENKKVSMDDHSDHTLVDAVRNGCLRAETEIHRRYNGAMRRALSRYVDNPMDGEDWLNSAWVIALTKLREGKLREPKALPGFLCGIARRVALGELRQRWRQTLRIAPEELETTLADVDASDVVAGHELVELTQGLLEDLTVDRDRELLGRCFFLDEDRDTVAATLQLDASVFSKTLHRARKRLWAAAERANAANTLREYMSEAR
ncbi:MAG: sigma-70 family RNA polymerase sigma factor [Pseudomonadota bacterium]